MGVKWLAQEHNAVSRPGLEPGTSDPESSALTIRPPRLPSPIAQLYIALEKKKHFSNVFQFLFLMERFLAKKAQFAFFILEIF